MSKYETENWPVMKARWFTPVPRDKPRNVRLIVIHTMEAPEGPQTAENVAKYFMTLPADKKASAHVCIDNNSVVQCVYDSDIAYAAPGANHDGIQIELAGYAKQSLKDWMDKYSIDLLMRAADVVSQYCLKYSIPPIFLHAGSIYVGAAGITGHVHVNQAFKKSSHTDPGPNFPWNFFLEAVKININLRKVGL